MVPLAVSTVASQDAPRQVPTAEPFDATGPTIKIGVIVSVTGDNKPWGDDSLVGARLAVEKYNRAGGFHGRKVEMVVQDSASRPEQAHTAAEKLLSDGCVALVGEISSGNTIQIGRAAFEKGVAVVAVGATRNDLTDEQANMFRVCYRDDAQGLVMAKFAYSHLGLRRVAILTDNHLPFSTGLSAVFRAAFLKLGGKVVAEPLYESGGMGTPSFSQQMNEVRESKAQGLFCSGYFTEMQMIAKQAMASGVRAKLLGTDGWDGENILIGGKAIFGSYMTNSFCTTDKRPRVSEFLKGLRTAYGIKHQQTVMGALGYDAMALTLNALTRAGKPNTKAIIDALENTVGFHGVTGDITLKGTRGSPLKRVVVVRLTKKNSKGDWQKMVKAYVPRRVGSGIEVVADK